MNVGVWHEARDLAAAGRTLAGGSDDEPERGEQEGEVEDDVGAAVRTIKVLHTHKAGRESLGISVFFNYQPFVGVRSPRQWPFTKSPFGVSFRRI